MPSAAPPLDVLVLDGNAVHRTRIVRSLSMYANADLRFAEAGAGMEGLRQLEEGAFDCVVVGTGLTDIDGLEVISRLCASRPVVPAIFLSDERDPRVEREALARGARVCLFKRELSAWQLARALDAIWAAPDSGARRSLRLPPGSGDATSASTPMHARQGVSSRS